MPKITIDDQTVQAEDGATILEAAREIGIDIPTLCHMDGLQSIGACRVCLVEVEGARDLIASCVMPVVESMVVHTNTAKVRNARRTVVELLLSEHAGDCLTCVRNEDCELQALARRLGVTEIRYPGEKTKSVIDDSTIALVRDSGKCVLCRRCVTVCNEVQGVGALFPQGRGFSTVIGPAFCQPLDSTVCVQCGQCAAVCPVGAISERDQIDEVFEALADSGKTVVVQTAPAIRAALGECFGYEPGTLVTGKMVTALRRLGFDAVFDTNFTADLTIIEEGHELLSRLKRALVDKEDGVALPQFTSCSPGWIQFAEYFYPDILPNISTCKSPQQMMGALIKTFYAEKIGKKPEDIVSVSVMPCTAKKFEASRPEMTSTSTSTSSDVADVADVADVDIVLTTRELSRMIDRAGIVFNKLEDGVMDAPLGLSSGAADIFANTGGVMEAAIRTAYEIVTGKEVPFENLHLTQLSTLEGVKQASLKIEGTVPEWSFLEGVELKVAVAHGLGNARKLIEMIKSGQVDAHFVEIMTCPGGCIGGGGQPRFTNDEVRMARINAIFREDEGKEIRKSHNNPDIAKLYEDYLGVPLGKLSHELLHTHYRPRSR